MEPRMSRQRQSMSELTGVGYFLTPFNLTLRWFYMFIYVPNPMFQALSTTSGVFCDFHKAPGEQ
jgi:hypothetical protein